MFFPFLYFSLLGLAVVTQLVARLVALRRDDLPRWVRWGHAYRGGWPKAAQVASIGFLSSAGAR